MTMLPYLLGIGFITGLSGALMPGPLLVGVIAESVKVGKKAGPIAIIGHLLIEVFIVIALLYGFATILGSARTRAIVAVVGGIALVVFGLQMVFAAWGGVELPSERDLGGIGQRPFITGIVTSVCNPYFWVWWATIGNALIVEGLKLGLLGVALVFVGHGFSDGGWYSFVSFSVEQGRGFLDKRKYRLLIVGCGVVLVLLGIKFILENYGILI